MRLFKRWILRSGPFFSILGFIISLVAFLGFFGVFNEDDVSPWHQLSIFFQSIHDKNPPDTIGQIFFIIIACLLPFLIGSSLSFWIYAKEYFILYKRIALKNKNISNILQVTLDDNMDFIKRIADNIYHGVAFSQNEINNIQGKILKNLPKKNFFATSLLEPDEILNDKNHMKVIQDTINDAKLLGVKLERYIVTSSLSALVSDTTILNPSLKSIRDWHKSKGFQLFVIDHKAFERLALMCQIKNEYLDFLLVDCEVIYGFMNDSSTYKTITASDKYTLFVKDSKQELNCYKKFVVELQKEATELTNLS
jgi:hypothetical protein